MRTLITVILVSLFLSHVASAQTPPEPSAGLAKQAACRDAALRKGLRGPDLANDVGVCMAQVRLECAQRVAAEHMSGPQRNDFMKSCMGGP